MPTQVQEAVKVQAPQLALEQSNPTQISLEESSPTSTALVQPTTNAEVASQPLSFTPQTPEADASVVCEMADGPPQILIDLDEEENSSSSGTDISMNIHHTMEKAAERVLSIAGKILEEISSYGVLPTEEALEGIEGVILDHWMREGFLQGDLAVFKEEMMQVLHALIRIKAKGVIAHFVKEHKKQNKKTKTMQNDFVSPNAQLLADEAIDMNRQIDENTTPTASAQPKPFRGLATSRWAGSDNNDQKSDKPVGVVTSSTTVTPSRSEAMPIQPGAFRGLKTSRWA